MSKFSYLRCIKVNCSIWSDHAPSGTIGLSGRANHPSSVAEAANTLMAAIKSHSDVQKSSVKPFQKRGEGCFGDAGTNTPLNSLSDD